MSKPEPQKKYYEPNIKPEPYVLSRGNGNNTKLDYQKPNQAVSNSSRNNNANQGVSDSTSSSSNQGISDSTGQNDDQQDNDRSASLKELDNQESKPENLNDGNESVAEQEKNGSIPWDNKTSSSHTGSSKSKISFSFLKKKGPLAAIVITIFGAILGMGLSTAYLPIGILANLVLKFNTQDTSLTIRAHRVIAAKMATDATSGSCVVVKIICRFSIPSGRFLKQLEKNGITALDKNGNIINNKLLWPNKRPDILRFTTSADKVIDIPAKDLYKALVSQGNKEFQAAFHLAQRTRFVSVSDYVFKFVATKFGFGINEKVRDVDSDEKLKTKVNEEVGIDDGGAKAAVGEGEEASESFLKKMLGTRATNIVKKLARSGRGDAAILIAGIVCLVGDTPGLIMKVQRDFQMIQLIKYGAIFLTAFGAIKSGDATAAETTAVGNQLTKVVDGKSAMDSFGMKYTMTGQTLPQNDKFKKFSPGMSMVAMLGGIAAITSSRAKIKACNVIANPVTGIGVNVLLAILGPETGFAAWIVLAINVALGFVLSYGLEYAAGPLIKIFLDLVTAIKPDFFSSILSFFFGDLTQNLSGESAGDALTSGAAHVMGQTGNAGGNMPMSVDQAVAYGNLTKQVQLAYAEEDRTTKSPFDATSPNTFLGSILQRLMPYSVNSSSIVGSLSGSLSSMGKLVTGSFGMALQPVGASATSDPGDEYRQCEDPGIMADDVAAGPFCNIIYGIPPKYLDKDPIKIVNELTIGKYAGNIDEETGDPVEGKDLAKWIDLCTDGTTDEAANCMIEDDERATYALYTIDHRVQKSMDEEDTTTTPTTEPSAGSTDPVSGTTIPENVDIISGNRWVLKDNVDYSNVTCASGTTDNGKYVHPIRKFTIRKCATDVGEVASIVSQKASDMVKAAKADSPSITLTGSSFRSYEEQQDLRKQNCPDPINSPSGDCEPPTAKAGDSNHEKGLAIDFNRNGIRLNSSNPEFSWLQSNAAKYGYINLPSENWHWSTSGG